MVMTGATTAKLAVKVAVAVIIGVHLFRFALAVTGAFVHR
jgi:vacuolar-type H+-ATPase subunit I/STV1